jgi:dCMP deaminase
LIEYKTRANLDKWDARFINLAEHVAGWSKGPRKRIGAVIVREDRSIASIGYNGPPRGFDDEAFLAMSREEQHKVVIHAEINAIRQAAAGERLDLCALYVSPLFPCHVCAKRIADSGLSRIVAYCGHISPDWRESSKEANLIFLNKEIDCLFVT